MDKGNKVQRHNDVAVDGLTGDGKLHINQKGLHIYAGINKHSLDMVKDFYRSFNGGK